MRELAEGGAHFAGGSERAPLDAWPSCAGRCDPKKRRAQTQLHRAKSHVVGVSRRRAFIRAEVLQDPADRVSCAQRDGHPAVELGGVPVHLGEREQLSRDLGRARLHVDKAEGECRRHVHPWVSPVERNAPTGVELSARLAETAGGSPRVGSRRARAWPGAPPRRQPGSPPTLQA